MSLMKAVRWYHLKFSQVSKTTRQKIPTWDANRIPWQERLAALWSSGEKNITKLVWPTSSGQWKPLWRVKETTTEEKTFRSHVSKSKKFGLDFWQKAQDFFFILFSFCFYLSLVSRRHYNILYLQYFILLYNIYIRISTCICALEGTETTGTSD